MKQIKPTGIYKGIDVQRHNKIIEILIGDNKDLKDKAVEGVLNNPNYYNPPVIYVLSKELFVRGRKPEAAYWFYVAAQGTL